MSGFDFLKQIITSYRYFYSYLVVDKHRFLLITLMILGITVTNTIIIWLIGKPFGYLAEENYAELTHILIFLAVIIFLNQVFHFFSTFLVNILGLRFVGRLRSKLLSQLVSLQYIATDKFPKGDLLARLSNDVDVIQRLIVESPSFLLSHLFTLIFYGAMLLYIDWQLAIAALLLSPLFLIQQKLFAAKKMKAAQGFLKSNGKLLTNEDEVLSNTRMVNALNAQERIVKRHRAFFQNAYDWAIRERKLDALFTSLLSMLIYGCALLVVYLGVQSAKSGEIEISGLVSFLIYMGYMSIPIRGSTQLLFQAQSEIMAGHRVHEILTEPSSNHLDDNFTVKTGSVTFNDVAFQYGERQILRSFNANFQNGCTTAIVGESGAGKSTLINLLLRFSDVDSGNIEIDQANIKNVSPQSLRENIAVVSQKPMMFSDTIKNNLLLAKQNATEQEISHVLKLSDCESFIQDLPSNVETKIGTEGIELSAGQLQRLQLAQALLKDSPILVLDEATSALDSQAEQNVVNSIRESRKLRTTLIIAHRYSSIRFADSVVYINNDGTATQATHEELLQNHEGYQKAIKWQENS